MHSGAVDNDFGFHWELFAFRVLTIDTDSTDDLAAVVFEESFKLNVVSKRGTFHAWDEIVHSRGKEAVKVHPRVVHLGLRHDRAPLTMQRFYIWISLAQFALAHDAWSVDTNLVRRAHQLFQIDQMIAKGSRPVPKGCPEQRWRRD